MGDGGRENTILIVLLNEGEGVHRARTRARKNANHTETIFDNWARQASEVHANSNCDGLLEH